MDSKQLSSKVSLYLSDDIKTAIEDVRVSYFDSKTFPSSPPNSQRLHNTMVDTTNWFVTDSSGLIPSTKYLLAGKPDTYFRDRIAGNANIQRADAGILCMNAGSSSNYYHWVAQTILSIVGYRRIINSSLPFLLNTGLSRYQLEWLDIIGLDRERILAFQKETTLEVGDLRILPTLYKPFDFTPCKLLISTIRELVYSNDIYDKNCAASMKKIYISRSDSRKPRGIQFENMLEDFLSKLGYTPVKMADFSVVQQIGMIASADSIIAAHGAGLTNIMFAKPTCNIVEINNENYVNTCFSRIWEAMENSTGKYVHLVCKEYKNTETIAGSSPAYHLSKCTVNYNEILSLI